MKHEEMWLGCYLLISEALDIQLLLHSTPMLFWSSTLFILPLPVYTVPVLSSEVVP